MSTIDVPALICGDRVTGRSVGSFRFGADHEAMIAEYGLELQAPVCPDIDWKTFAIPSCESIVFASASKLDAVLSSDSLRYGEQELLDREWDVVRVPVGPNDEAWSLITGYTPIIYDRPTLTIRDDDDRVKSAPFCVIRDESRPL